ncbi:hypothetical protein [Dactylosporangium sp. NPDC051484]|uniref:hypothetical protein n=1 Tax=Dactylosporangium sp. NPDC051484 TaxID=3154942 RepID=UPI00344B630D
MPDARFSATVLPVLDACYGTGQHLAVHCRFGIGRSATVAAAVRGVPVPDIDAQRRWVEQLVT